MVSVPKTPKCRCIKKALGRKGAPSEEKSEEKVVEKGSPRTCCLKEIPEKLTNVKNVITSTAESIKEVIKPETDETDKEVLARSFDNKLYNVE
uniref:Uncharacterized protein n=1 Tax=Panagrellus redivivus TaxID=6233 RepID=A0A7E4ZYR8_PANRE